MGYSQVHEVHVVEADISNLDWDLPVQVILLHYVSPSSAVASLEAVLYWHSDDGVGGQLPTLSGQKENWASCCPLPQEVLYGRG